MAGTIELRDMGQISSATSGQGHAGAVVVTATGSLAIIGDPAPSS
jgi:hypothetical protein